MSSHAGTPAATAAPVDALRFDELAAYGDATFVRDVVDTFVADARTRIAAIATALRDEDHIAAGREAHALKSASAAVGVEPLRVLASALERAARDGLEPGDPVPAMEAALVAAQAWFAQRVESAR